MQIPIVGKPSKFTRRNALRLITAGMVASLIDARWIEPGLLSITRQDRVFKQLPTALDALRIGLLADFHFRPDQDAELLDKVVAQVRREKLDLIAPAGDFINGDSRVLTPLLASLEKMSATHGVFAVMGNHDGWNGDRTTIKRQFEKAGISFMINQHCPLPIWHWSTNPIISIP